MRCWALSAVAAATVFATPAAADPHGHWRGGGRDGGGYSGRYEGPRGIDMGRSGGPRGEGRWAGRIGPPRSDRWDDRRHDGYWIGSRWHYGPPPETLYDSPGFRPGFAPWRRGAFLPPYYSEDVLEDYPRYHLRRPPAGYRWVRVGGTALLVSSATGLIFDVIDGF